MASRPLRLFASAMAAGTSLVGLILPASVAHASSARVVVAAAALVPHGDQVVNAPGTVRVDLALASKDPTGLQRFLTGIATPTSALYRHFLRPAAFAREFGASTSALATVRSYFDAQGLTVRSSNTARTVLEFSGPTTAVEKAFATRIIGVRVAGVRRAAFARVATLPTDVALDVRGVAGLSSVLTPSSDLITSSGHASHSLSAGRVRSAAAAPTPATCASATKSATSGGGFTVQQQAQLYGFTGAWTKGLDGSGETIALYELAKYNPKDVSTFFSCYGVNPTLSTVNVDGGPRGSYNDEATLDIEEAGALAPGATLRVYQSANNTTDPIDLYARIADDDVASVVSTSWGDCEIDPAGAVQVEQTIFEQMAAQGQTVIAAAGDAGSSDCNGIVSNAPAVDDPASQPLVTGVGGLNVASISPLVESVWNSHQGARGGAGGGGISQIWSRPSWQSETGISVSDTMRLVPDVSVMGDPRTGFIQYYPGSASGAWSSIGGTSIGAPLLSALVATAAQVCSTTRLGLLNPTLYRLARSGTGFVDVVNGNNDLFGTGVYSAGVGYDMASGIGSPSTSLIDDLCPPSVDPSQSTITTLTPTSYVSVPSHLSVALRDASGNPVTNESLTVIAKSARGFLTIDADPASVRARGVAVEDVTSDTNGQASFTISDTAAEMVTVTVKHNGVILFTQQVSVRPVPLSLKKPLTPHLTNVRTSTRSLTITLARRASGTPFVTAVQVSLDGGQTWRAYPARLTRIEVTHLARHTIYEVRVRARNANGVSPATRERRVRTPA